MYVASTLTGTLMGAGENGLTENCNYYGIDQ